MILKSYYIILKWDILHNKYFKVYFDANPFNAKNLAADFYL